MCDSAETVRNEGKLLTCLGLCVRAGNAVIGAPQIYDALKKGGLKRPLIVFEAADTSDNTHKKISDKCRYYNVEHIRLDCDGMTLAIALGKTSSLAAVAVTDENMKKMIEKHI